MNPEIKKLIDDLSARIVELEKYNFRFHRHTGLDGKKVLFRDLDTILYKELLAYNPGSLVDGAGETKSVTVTGASLGDFVLVSAPYDLQDITVTGYVQAADTVEIRIQNESGLTVDLASGLWRIIVIKKFI